MLLRSIHFKTLRITYRNAFIFKCNVNQEISKPFFAHNFRQLSTSCENISFLEEQLKEVFKFKNTNVSNWIIEVSNVKCLLDVLNVTKSLLMHLRDKYKKISLKQIH